MALAVAGVVVANPIVVPRSDVLIPAVKLSAGTDDAAGMLDQSFLDAIAPAPPESTNPFAVLKDLISSLAADATSLGRNVIVDAFVAGITAVSEPELTAFSTPYVPPVLNSPELAMSVLPGIETAKIEALLPASEAISEVVSGLADPVALVNEKIAPVVTSLVRSFVGDVGFVGGELIAAAFAAGAVVANEPKLIGDTLAALVRGDLRGALHGAIKVVIAPLGPPTIVIDAIRTVAEKYLTGLAGALAPPAIQPVQEPTAAVQTPAVTAADLESTPVRPDGGGRTAAPVLPTLAEIAVQLAAAVLGAPQRAQTGVPTQDLAAIDAEAEAGTPDDATAAAPRRAVAAVRDAGKPAGKSGAQGRAARSAAVSD